MVILVALIVLAIKLLLRSRIVSRAGTWDCGYARPAARMQYTSSSFGQMLVGLFSFVLWPKTNRPDIRGIFPRGSRFKISVPDTVLDRLVMPIFRAGGRYLPELRILQQGRTHFYVFYIMIIVIVLLIFGAIGVQP